MTTNSTIETKAPMSETFRALLETIDAELVSNNARIQQGLAERERLTAARAALVTTPGKSAPARRPVRPTKNPNPGIPDSIKEVLREHPGHPVEVTVRMVADLRKVTKNTKAIRRIEAALAAMITSNAVHKSPEGTLSLPATPD